MLSPLKPLYGVIFFEENLTLFKDVNNKDLVTFYGNDGYDAAIVPLLLGFTGKINRLAGAAMFLCFAGYNWYLLSTQIA